MLLQSGVVKSFSEVIRYTGGLPRPSPAWWHTGYLDDRSLGHASYRPARCATPGATRSFAPSVKQAAVARLDAGEAVPAAARDVRGSAGRRGAPSGIRPCRIRRDAVQAQGSVGRRLIGFGIGNNEKGGRRSHSCADLRQCAASSFFAFGEAEPPSQGRSVRKRSPFQRHALLSARPRRTRGRQ
jgi:hypothetical protein